MKHEQKRQKNLQNFLQKSGKNHPTLKMDKAKDMFANEDDDYDDMFEN